MKLTAIDAIRQTADINIKPRTVKTSKLTYKLFGLEGAIASKQFKRNRSRYRATVISLFMSIVLFISASSFCRYLTDSVSDVFEEYDYDICYSFGDTPTLSSGAELTPDYAADVLSDTQGVTKVSFESHIRASIDLGAESLSKDAQQKLLTHGGDSELIYTNVASIYGVDDDTFRQYLKEQGLRESDYFDESSPLAVVMSEQSLVNYDTERIEKTQVLDESLKSLTIPVFSDALYKELYPDETKTAQDDLSQCYVDLTVNIGAHVTELPFGLNRARHYNIIIVYPLSTFRQVVSDSSITSTVYFKTDGHKAAMDALTEKAKDAGIPTTPLYDVYATSEVERNIVLIVKVFSYGFITLISLISLANVFNTISTNIMLRRREFAMLKSVGMTSHGFNKMMNFECILYGVKSLIYGIPVAFILTYLMFRTVSSGYDADFYLPWSAVITVIVSVFAVVFATMMYSMRKIKQENPIDALKLETT
jgi:putative ABC transport system permease protein